MESIDALKTTQPAQALPDISTWTNQFTEWGIWPDIAGTGGQVSVGSREPGLGLFLAEARVATRRIFAWTAVLIVLGLVFGFIALANLSTLSVFGAGFFFGLISLAFLGAAVYRVGIWFLNRDLVVRVFREGFSLAGNGETQLVRWRDVSAVRVKWMKMVIQAIIHINIHNLTIYLANGEKIELNRTLDKVEEISALMQAAAADFMLPATIERLKNDEACEFGSFKISRYGIARGKNKVLPWTEVNSLIIGNVGQTTLTFFKAKATSWGTVTGDSIPNLQLFITLVTWFIDAAKQPIPVKSSGTDASTAIPEEQFNGDVQYGLFISQQEARLGTEKKLYVGPANHEQRLVVKIPAGVASGTVYPFPGYGRPATQGGAMGTLHVAILVEKGKGIVEALQLAAGALLLMPAMIWLAFWSSLDLILCVVLAALIGGLGGTIMAMRHRRIGAISGVTGAVISYFLQILYYQFMYSWFGRDGFSDYEIVFVFLASALPGVGLYWWLLKKQK